MAKKKKTKTKIDTSTPAPPRNQPFASLAHLCPTQKESERESSDSEHGAHQAPRPAIQFRQKLILQREKKGRAGKTITRIRGLPKEHLQTFQVQMKKALGCGAIIEENDLLLLGSLVERAATWLKNQGAKDVIQGN